MMSINVYFSRRSFMWRRTLTGWAVAMLIAAPAVAGGSYLDATAGSEARDNVGSETCPDRHDDMGACYTDSPHAVERHLTSHDLDGLSVSERF
jgi:hypothetical protein